LSGQIRWERWRRIYTKADITDAVAVARHACHDARDLTLAGICSGSWFAAHTARRVGAQSAIMVNPMVWSWSVIPTLVQQWDAWRQTRHTNAANDSGGSPSASMTYRVKKFLDSARETTKSVLHNHVPRYLLRVLSWVGLVFLPEDVLTKLAHRGTDVTLILSPWDSQQFTARVGPAGLDRLQRMSQPARLIAVPIGDHSAHHPAILATIRNAVLPVAATPSRRERNDLQIGVGA